MARKIKLHTFHFLFRLFAYLADKSGGWRMFVLPKLLLGSLIVGLGLTMPRQIEAQSQNTNQQKKKNTVSRNTPTNKTNLYQTVDNVSCYITTPATKEYGEKVFEFVEQKPQYPGGENELKNYISQKLKYPSIAKENGIQGRVVVRFIVTNIGKIERVEILRSLDPMCDKEAIRVVKSLPVFIPGKQNGVNVSVWYTIPVIFKLSK